MAQPASWLSGLGRRMNPVVETLSVRGKLARGVQLLRQHPRAAGVIVGGLVLGVVFFLMGPQNTDKAALAPASAEADAFPDIDLDMSHSGESKFLGGFYDGLDSEATANSRANIPTSVEVPRLFSPLADTQNENSIQPAGFQSETQPAWLTGIIEVDDTPARQTQLAPPNAPFGRSR